MLIFDKNEKTRRNYYFVHFVFYTRILSLRNIQLKFNGFSYYKGEVTSSLIKKCDITANNQNNL